MTPNDLERLRRRAKAGFERARARRSLAAAIPTLPMIGISLLTRGPSIVLLVSGALLFAVVAGMAHAGRFFGRGVGPGLFAGVPPLVVPLVLHCVGHACAISECVGCACSSVCLPACMASGGVAGAIIGLATMSEAKRPLGMLLSASAIAIVAGSLGCVFAGLSGVVAMALATVAASAPVSALVRWRARTPGA